MGGGRAGSAGQDTMLEHGTRGDAMDSSKEHSEMGGFATHLPAETAPRKDTDQMGEGTDDAAVAVITVTEQKAPRAELQHVDEAPPTDSPPPPTHRHKHTLLTPTRCC